MLARKRGAAAIVTAMMLLFPATAPADGGAGDDLNRVLREFDAAQRGTGTMVARFTEEKHLRLLEAPVVSRGELTFSRPNQVRWEYDDPERKVFIVTEEMYAAYHPALRRAEEVPFRAFVGRRLLRFLGLGQSIDDLGAYYDFRLEADNDLEGTHLLVLTPRRRRLRERLVEMRLWIDGESALPRRIGYLDADGDSTLITLHDPRVNVAIDADRFRLALPPDVIVSNRFNGFALGGGGL
ncbi:MAG TPA: outer membrane lipoprotein carrier protein LolA [Candidatus Polarisedimenticolia bacterium]|nr:outer membrane lipoprotein carrier protein LolA [Candidatus Polarisedimenticolia bacterium]